MSRLVILVGALALGACTESEPIQVGRGLGGAGGAGSGPAAPGDGTSGVEPGQVVEVDAGAPLEYRDEDFVEAETNRDPFRSYAAMFVVRPVRAAQTVQVTVLMRNTAIDEMRLIAIVSGVPNPSAMIADREGVGHTVHRGTFIGRPEIVSTGGEDAVPIPLNWRVDRIHPAEIVLVRQDPTAPNRPPLTRVIPLHGENEAEADGQGTLGMHR